MHRIAAVDELRIPMSVAARRGISAVAALAGERRVVLTNHGRPVAVVDSAERLDDTVHRMREAAMVVLDAGADLVAQRSGSFDLDGVCERLGLDAEAVRARAAAQRSAGP